AAAEIREGKAALAVGTGFADTPAFDRAKDDRDIGERHATRADERAFERRGGGVRGAPFTLRLLRRRQPRRAGGRDRNRNRERGAAAHRRTATWRRSIVR